MIEQRHCQGLPAQIFVELLHRYERGIYFLFGEELLNKLMQDVRHHIEEEEGDLLPKLRAACSPEELADLGEKIQRAKKIAPTRPHPSAPSKPPANLILAPGTAFIDKIRDALSGRNT